jgi:hypothetical protein
VLVALVQGVVRAFHEDLCPFDQGRGQESGECADKNFLEEGGVHTSFESNDGASNQTLCGRCRSLGTRVANFSIVMTESAQPKPNEIDPEKLTRLLELELIQKRATWKQTGERARSIRTAGLAFLVLLIVGCLVGGYFVFMRVSEQRANPPQPTLDH